MIIIAVILLVGLFFYFPEMTSVERVWITLICEHLLLLFKVVLDMLLSSSPKEVLPPSSPRTPLLFLFCLYPYWAFSSFGYISLSSLPPPLCVSARAPDALDKQDNQRRRVTETEAPSSFPINTPPHTH